MTPPGVLLLTVLLSAVVASATDSGNATDEGPITSHPLVTDPPAVVHTSYVFAGILAVVVVAVTALLMWFAWDHWRQQTLKHRQRSLERVDSEMGEQRLDARRSVPGAASLGAVESGGALEQPGQTPAARNGWRVLSGSGDAVSGVAANVDAASPPRETASLVADAFA